MKARKKAPDIRSLRLFDTCVTLGRIVRAGTPECITADNVLAVLDKHDIAEALVHHNEARLTRPRKPGNEALLKDIKGMPRLHPVWALEPPKSPDPAAARAMVDEMLGRGVKVARLMMSEAPPVLWLWDDLCTELEAHRVPCMLDFGVVAWPASSGATQGNPDNFAVQCLRDICLAHPALPMVLSHVSGGLGLAYAVLPLMRRVPNLHMDITSVVDYWRTAATQIGPERVVFATGMPYYDPATFISNVQYTHQIDADAKRKICGDNMRAMMEAVL
jgi:predicted TIM-barrel fold metal-dependent hydrolase